jgi:hypothetical protein
MIIRTVSARLCALVLCTLVTTACGGSSTPPGAAPVTTTTADVTGDATSGGGTAWDITQVATVRAATGATSLVISVTFAQAISAANLPPPGSQISTPAQLGAAVLLATGGAGLNAGFTNCTGNPTFANVTFAVDPGAFSTARLADGNFAVINAVTLSATGEATIAFTGSNTLTYTVPLAAIGGGSGAVKLAVVALNGAGPPGNITATDCAPNATFVST